MTYQEFKSVVLHKPEDMEEKLYNYGYTCGQRNVLNFEIIEQAFYIYNYSKKARLYYMRKILRGFQEGCASR